MRSFLTRLEKLKESLQASAEIKTYLVLVAPDGQCFAGKTGLSYSPLGINYCPDVDGKELFEEICKVIFEGVSPERLLHFADENELRNHFEKSGKVAYWTEGIRQKEDVPGILEADVLLIIERVKPI